jgi:uncharacterized phage protein gp47/JayE
MSARIPSLPLAALAGEMLRAPRVSLADLIADAPPVLREVLRRGFLDHAQGAWLDLLGTSFGVERRAQCGRYAAAMGLDTWRVEGAARDVVRG